MFSNNGLYSVFIASYQFLSFIDSSLDLTITLSVINSFKNDTGFRSASYYDRVCHTLNELILNIFCSMKFIFLDLLTLIVPFLSFTTIRYVLLLSDDP